MNSVVRCIRDLLFSINMNNDQAELVQNVVKTKAVKRIHIKMLKFKIKQNEHVNKY